MNNFNIEKEIWKDIEGYEGCYQVSNLGRVRSVDRTITRKDGVTVNVKGRVLSTPPNQDGYPHVNLHKDGQGNSQKVHRLVAKAFIPNPQKNKEINHIDENKANNDIENLEWCTRKHNMNHGTIIERVQSHPSIIKAREESKKAVIGVHIKTGDEVHFESVNEADRSGFPRRNVFSVIHGYDKSCRGYVWFYESEYTEELKNERLKYFKVKIKQLDDAGNVLNEFYNMTEASEVIGIHASNISRAVSTGRRSGGYYWKKEM